MPTTSFRTSWCKAFFPFCLFGLAAMLFPMILHGKEARKEETVRFETGLYYTIQRGDTLWDISKQFYDSSYIWPDLWQKNEYIPNPNWIYPGNRIKLYDRIEQNAIPAQQRKKEKKRSFFTYDPIDRVGFIRKKAVIGSGEVIGSEKQKWLLSVGDELYIHSDEGKKFDVGDRFFVFRHSEASLEHPLHGDEVGIQHLILGVLVMTEVLPDIITATVVEAYEEIEKGDRLMPYKRRSRKIETVDAVPGLEGIILSADEQNDRTVFSEGVVVFIDKGEVDGVRAGQAYDIYVQEEETFRDRDRDTRHLLPPPVVIGRILILHTEKTTATVLITSASRDVCIGDKIHADPASTDMADPVTGLP